MIHRSHRFSIRGMFLTVTLVALATSHLWTSHRLHQSRGELSRLRRETGYLEITDARQVAAARVPEDAALTWRFRIATPAGQRFRLAYSTRWLARAAQPDWYSFIAVPSGEAIVTVQIAVDPRDGNWKVSAQVRQGTEFLRRSLTVLPEDQVEVFRGTHQVLSSATVTGATVQVPADRSLRLLADQWLVGESGMLLFGDRPPETDRIGVFLELQPDP